MREKRKRKSYVDVAAVVVLVGELEMVDEIALEGYVGFV
jgi:hypothetical protein